jgi:poly(hydroxyalkanoate) granule-associated protein
VRGKESNMAVKKKGKLAGKSTPSGAGRDQPLPFSAHQIWSAGLGAMARAQEGGTKFFEDLVREGSRLQGSALTTAQKVVMQAVQGAQQTVNRRVDGVKGQATETWDNLEKIFQTRVQRALHQLGMPTAEEIGALTRKVNELTDSVDKLARVQGSGRAAAPASAARRKKPAKKAKRKSTKSSRGRQSRS